MDIIFEDIDLEELITTGKNKKYKKYQKNSAFLSSLADVYGILCAAPNANSLYNNSHLHYEQLKYDYSGLCSMHIKNGYVERLIVRETDEGLTLVMIELNTTHYGNKK